MESFIAEMKAFVASVLEDKTPLVTGSDGCTPVMIGMAANSHTPKTVR